MSDDFTVPAQGTPRARRLGNFSGYGSGLVDPRSVLLDVGRADDVHRHDAQRGSKRLYDAALVDPDTAAVEQHMVVRAKAQDVVEGVRPVVRPAYWANVRSLAVTPPNTPRGYAVTFRPQ